MSERIVKLKELKEKINTIRNNVSTLEKEAKELEQSILLDRSEKTRNLLTPELVDVLAPEHCRTSCKDGNLNNSSAYDGKIDCNRCFLLANLNNKQVDDFVFDYVSIKLIG